MVVFKCPAAHVRTLQGKSVSWCLLGNHYISQTGRWSGPRARLDRGPKSRKSQPAGSNFVRIYIWKKCQRLPLSPYHLLVGIIVTLLRLTSLTSGLQWTTLRLDIQLYSLLFFGFVFVFVFKWWVILYLFPIPWGTIAEPKSHPLGVSCWALTQALNDCPNLEIHSLN